MNRDLKSKSGSDLLTMLGQSEQAKENFFRPLVLATLNADLHEVSAELFRRMLKTIFSSPASDSVLAYSTIGFSELIAKPAADFITKNGGEIILSTPIKEIKFDGDKAAAISDENGIDYSADEFIIALPPDALMKIVPAGEIDFLSRWVYSPIISVNIWFDRPVMDRMAVGLIDGHFHWCFDKSSIIKDLEKHRYVTLLASSAYDKMSMTRDQIVRIALDDMNEFFPESRLANILHSQVISERKATVLITPDMVEKRSKARTKRPNLYLAGDWTDTGLPATIESAAKSGFDAAALCSC